MDNALWQARQRGPSSSGTTSSSDGNSSSCSDLPMISRANGSAVGDDNKVYKYAPDIKEVLQEAQKADKVAEAMELVRTLPSKLVGTAKKLLEGLPDEVVMVAIAQCVWRRGSGGRQAAKDPRLDPSIDAKKARQILNNRKNAAISQLRKKIAGLAKQARQHSSALQQPSAAPHAAAAPAHDAAPAAAAAAAVLAGTSAAAAAYSPSSFPCPGPLAVAVPSVHSGPVSAPPESFAGAGAALTGGGMLDSSAFMSPAAVAAAAAVMDPAQAAAAAANAAWQAAYFASLAARQQTGGGVALQLPGLPGLPPVLPSLAAFNPALLAASMGQFVQWAESTGLHAVPAVSTAAPAPATAPAGAAPGAEAAPGTSRRLVASILGVGEAYTSPQTPSNSSNSNSDRGHSAGPSAEPTMAAAIPAASEAPGSVLFEACQVVTGGSADPQPASVHLRGGGGVSLQQQQVLLGAPAVQGPHISSNSLTSASTAAPGVLVEAGTAATAAPEGAQEEAWVAAAAAGAPAAFGGPIVALDSAEVSRELGCLLLSSENDTSAADSGLLCLQESLDLQCGSHSPTAVDAALESFARSLSCKPPAQQAQRQQHAKVLQQSPGGGAAAGGSAAINTGVNNSGTASVLGVPSAAGMGCQQPQQDTAGWWDQGVQLSAAAAGGAAGLVPPPVPAGLPRCSSAAVQSADVMPVLTGSWEGAAAAALGAAPVRRVASSPNISSSVWQHGGLYGMSADAAAHAGQGVSDQAAGAPAGGGWGEALQGQEPVVMMGMGGQEVNWYDDTMLDLLSDMDF